MAASVMSEWTLVTGEGVLGMHGPEALEELNSPEFKAELQQVVDELGTGVLKDLSSMSKYCLEPRR